MQLFFLLGGTYSGLISCIEDAQFSATVAICLDSRTIQKVNISIAIEVAIEV